MMKNLSLKQKILLSVVIALSLVISLLSWQSYSSQKVTVHPDGIDRKK